MSEDAKGYVAGLVLAIPVLFWLIRIIFTAFRDGQIAARGVIHERRQHSFYFWFYVFAYGSLALAIVVFGTIAVVGLTAMESTPVAP